MSTFSYLYLLVNLQCLLITTESIIFSNHDAETGQFPATVAVLLQKSGSWDLIASGTLLTPLYVMSYLFCEEQYGQLKIVAGAIEWRNSQDKAYQERLVTHMFKRYKNSEVLVPFEMYRVNSPFVATYAVGFAALNFHPPSKYWTLTTAGFGHSFFEDQFHTPILVWVNVTITDKKRCTLSENPILQQHYLCLTNTNEPRTTFVGCDYGAPVYFKQSVVGILGPSIECDYIYSNLIRLHPFMQWISQNSAWDGESTNPDALPIEGRIGRHRGRSMSVQSVGEKPYLNMMYLVVSAFYLYPFANDNAFAVFL